MLCCGGNGDQEPKVAGDEESERLARLRHVVIARTLHLNAHVVGQSYLPRSMLSLGRETARL